MNPALRIHGDISKRDECIDLRRIGAMASRGRKPYNVSTMLHAILYGLFCGFTISVPIGPANLELIKRGLSRGYRQALHVGIGTAFSDALLSTLAYLGVVPLFYKLGVVQLILYCGGGVMLVAIGIASLWQTWHCEDPFRIPDEQPSWAERYHRMNPLLLGFLINTTNPMVVAFWIFFFSTVVQHRLIGHSLLDLVVFPLAVFAGAFFWFSLLALLVSRGKQYVGRVAYRSISTVCNTVMIVVGLWFVLSFLGHLR